MFDSQLYSSFFTLMGIVAFLGVLYLFIKRYAKSKTALKGMNIKIHERVAVFPKGHLIIAEIGGKFFLLGATEQSINILKELEIEDIPIEKERLNISAVREPEDLSFKSFIKSTLKSKNNN
ncbi:MAG: flagellar biosynthetic protein FliO [Ignavibacteriae bacterium]|nr:flagellar biosynthetic protein FliO [Ignavibacteriota bacterium]MCB9221522.1 flagellar biosynthetic protein FliO [Ignavibacteria bacterium]MCB9222376.1 flagellar biosynthetic protein FliO [Ignavibacteria bacterium]